MKSTGYNHTWWSALIVEGQRPAVAVTKDARIPMHRLVLIDGEVYVERCPTAWVFLDTLDDFLNKDLETRVAELKRAIVDPKRKDGPLPRSTP